MNSKIIVFTNGCFDILHEGHLYLLQQAKKLGNYLIVGLNSDESVKRLKGESRPINNLEKRIKNLSEIKCIDEVIIFYEDTPLELIKRIKPDILVKGNDYNIDGIVGKEFVQNVVIIDRIKNLSTTGIINESKRTGRKI